MATLPEQFAAAFLFIEETIQDREFKPREARVLHLINKLSFGRGFMDANIDRLDHFMAVGISRGNAHGILDLLKRMGILEEPVKGFYGFLFPVTDWKVPVRAGDVRLLRQLELLERPPSLRSAMREVFVETMPAAVAGIHEKRTQAPADSPKDPPAWPLLVVPEVGTAVPKSGREQPHEHEHEKQHAFSMPHGHAVARPKLGTERSDGPFDPEAVLKRTYPDVGLGLTGREILDQVRKAAPGLKKEFEDAYIRRIHENAALVFELATEAAISTGIRNKPAWLNRAYMREMRLGRWSARA